ncbi:MAG: hypothetical protein GJ680_00035 [Alteromonadaceae bacterium]|nr:hypothetical protein [Alteromonadaceae bacterium]
MRNIFTTNGKNEVDVLFCIEHFDREIEVVIELTRLLCKQKLSVGIASTIFHIYEIANKIKPRVVVTASTAFGKNSVGSLLYERYGQSIKFVNLNYEQFISSWKGDYKSTKSAFAKEHQTQLVWGEYYKKILIESGFNRDNIHITGRPHLKYLKNRYDSVNKKSAELLSKVGLNTDKKTIFIALTDGLAFAKPEKIDYIISQGAIEHELRDSIRIIKSNLHELFRQISEFDGLDVQFVLRPHPSVPTSKYEDIFKEQLRLEKVPENVSILKDYDAYTWLMISDCFITNYSTLCIEAGALGVPTFAFQCKGESLGKGVWYMNSIQTIEHVSASLEQQTLKFKTNNYYMDFELDGIELTIKALLRQLSQSKACFSNKMPLVFRKRILGSLARRFAVKYDMLIGMMPRTQGLVNDYFNHETIMKKLQELEADV